MKIESLVTGAVLGVYVVVLAWVTGKALGVSSGFGTVCSFTGLSYFKKKPFDEKWRLWFLIGMPLGGFVSASVLGVAAPKLEIGLFETLFGQSVAAKAVLLILGGFFVGFGSRWAGG